MGKVFEFTRKLVRIKKLFKMRRSCGLLFLGCELFRIERIREQFEKDSRKGGKRESKRARTFGFCFCFSAPTPIPSTTWEEQRNQRFRCDLLSLIRKRKVPRARRRSDLARRIQKIRKRVGIS